MTRHVIQFRVSSEQKAEYEARAEASDMELSEWIRSRLDASDAGGKVMISTPAPSLPKVTKGGSEVKVERPTLYSDRMRIMRERGLIR